MIDQQWRAVMGRWGDAVWRVALVRTGDAADAQRLVVAAFQDLFGAAPPPADTHAALLQHLLRSSRRPRISLRRDRGVPRALLFLWLSEQHDGAQLAALTHRSPAVLVEQIAGALLPFLPRRDRARRTAQGRVAFHEWITAQLGFAALPALNPPAPGDAAWHRSLADVRDLFNGVAVGQRLPPACRAAIELALEAREDDTPAWQQWAGWLGAALLVVGAILVLRPPPAAGNAAAAAPPLDARDVVQHALDTWTTAPVSGTLHRRVWATGSSTRFTPGVVTDVWLDAAGRHRVEARRNNELVEWQVGDGSAKLLYDANSPYTSCRWGRRAPRDTRATWHYVVDAAQQQAARDARLQHGAYGRGYQALQAALRSPTLRSFGTRTENGAPVLLLGYTDEAVSTQRVLLFDAQTGALRAVRDVLNNGGQTVARDVWRMEAEETVAAPVSLTPPENERVVLHSKRILDPACLGLDASFVVSVRTLVGNDWGWWLPTRLPPDVNAAVLLSDALVTTQDNRFWIGGSPGITAVFAGGNRTLRMRVQQAFINLDGSVARGPWRVLLGNEEPNVVTAQACRPPAGYVACPPDQPSVFLEARGWTEAEVLDLIDGLAPATAPGTWQALHDLFLEPQPLDQKEQDVLFHALRAVDVPNGMLHSTVEITQSTARQQGDAASPPQRTDPYAVPHAWLSPERTVVEQTAALSDGTVIALRETEQLPDGTLLRARVLNEDGWSHYNGLNGMSFQESATAYEPSPRVGLLRVQEHVRAFVAGTVPPTLRDGGDTWVLEQPATTTVPYSFERMDRYGGDPNGPFVERLWIDKRSGLPRRVELVNMVPSGQRTVVSAINVVMWKIDPKLPATPFTLPPLPNDVITTTHGDSGQPQVVGDLARFMPPARELVWPDTDAVKTMYRSSPNRPLDVLRGAQAQAFLATSLLNNGFAQFEAIGAIRSTRYRLANGTTQFTLQQGAAPLMRHVLRAGSFRSDDGAVPVSGSRVLSVTIAGQEHTAWLLQRADALPMFVVEVDDVLVYTDDLHEADIMNMLLGMLPLLQWADRAEG